MGDQGSGERKPGSPLGAALGGGVQFAASILLGAFAGHWLDRRIGTEPWLVIAGTFVGAGAGFYSLYRALTANQPR